ncbi:hypothetical protein NC652_011100 [Populus alba x Populus x berolinensis]|nr:hypothetical protein NC652_011100 [Populus alba x Populus x berolinensis]
MLFTFFIAQLFRNALPLQIWFVHLLCNLRGNHEYLHLFLFA